MSKTHFFQDSVKQGNDGERLVAGWLEQNGFIVRATGFNENNKGVDLETPDFLVEGHKTGGESALKGKTVEVKADSRGHETGYCAFELLSNARSGRRGWAYNERIDFLAYLLSETKELFLVPMKAIRENLDNWGALRAFAAKNQFFHGVGLLVPLDKIKPLCTFYGRIG